MVCLVCLTVLAGCASQSARNVELEPNPWRDSVRSLSADPALIDWSRPDRARAGPDRPITVGPVSRLGVGGPLMSYDFELAGMGLRVGNDGNLRSVHEVPSTPENPRTAMPWSLLREAQGFEPSSRP
jgi:hypothetical protein